MSTVGADQEPVVDLRDRFGPRPVAPVAASTGATDRAGAEPRPEVVRRVSLLEGLARLNDALGDVEGVLTRLAPVARAALHVDLVDAVLCDPGAARVCATATPTRSLAAVIRHWRRQDAPAPVPVGTLVAVPMLVEREVVGALRLRNTDERPLDEPLALAVAAAVGAVAVRTATRARLAAAERTLAIAAERERVGLDAYDTVHRRLRAAHAALIAGGGDAAGQVARADAEIVLAADATAFLGQAQRGLVPALRSLVRTVASPTVAIRLRVHGEVRPLTPTREAVLVRVAHDLLRIAVRHARAATVTMTLAFADERVSLVVRDDGTGTAERATEHPGLHSGLRTLQRRLAELGGGLDLANLRPHGVCLHAWIATET